MSKHITILLLGLLFFAAGCHKKDQSATVISRTDFPVSVGSWWRYQVVNNMTGTMDTMTGTVVNAFGLNGAVSYMWVNTYTSGITADTVLATDMDTAISFGFYGYNSRYLTDLYIRFPIAAGRDWAEPGASDETVTPLGTYSLPGRSYANVSLLTCTKFVPDATKVDSVYISPAIGVVKRKKIIQGWGLFSNTINLIDYHIVR